MHKTVRLSQAGKREHNARLTMQRGLVYLRKRASTAVNDLAIIMQTFKNLICGREVSLHSVLIGGAPWFRGNDIADSMDYANSHQAIRHHIDDEDRAPLKDLIKDSDATPLKYNEGAQTFISEFGLYSLILGSRKPQAKIMQRWVTHEVLPNIRQSAQDTKSTQDSETQSTNSETQNTKSPDIDTYLKRKRAELEVAEIDERIQSCKRRCFEESVFALQRCGLHMTDAERMISKDRIREIAFGPRFDVNNLSDSDDEQ